MQSEISNAARMTSARALYFLQSRVTVGPPMELSAILGLRQSLGRNPKHIPSKRGRKDVFRADLQLHVAKQVADRGGADHCRHGPATSPGGGRTGGHAACRGQTGAPG